VKSRLRFVVILGILGLLASMMVVQVVSGATATLRIAKTSSSAPATGTGELLTWTSNSGSLVLEIDDSDRNTGATNTPTFAAQTCAINTNLQFDRFSTPAVVAPILDNDGNGIITYADVTVVSPGTVQIFSVNAVDGIIIVRCTAALAGVAVSLSYKSGAVNDTAGTDEAYDGSQGNEEARVWSDADPTGITVVLRETSATSGIFRATVAMKSSAGSVAGDIAVPTAAQLFVNKTDTVKFSYKDNTSGTTYVTQTSSVPVETAGPAFGAQTPSNGTATPNNLPTVTGEMTDTDSGVVKSTAQILWGRDNDSDGDIDEAFYDAIASADLGTIDNGKSFTQRFATGNAVNTDHDLYWWATINDLAGNVGVSDRQPTTSAGAADACDDAAFMTAFDDAAAMVAANPAVGTSAAISGCQPFKISIDRTAPSLSSATTGQWWDTSLTGSNKTQTSVTKAHKNSIIVDFGEAIQGDSVQASDFKVAGSVPISATHYSGNKSVVFLEVGDLDADARPKVEVVSDVADAAGNVTDSSKISAATDGIAPTLTVTTAGGTRPVVKSKVKITVASDEGASTSNVSVTVGRIENDTTVPAAGTTSVTISGGPTSWSGNTSGALADGLYTVYTTAVDLNVSTNIGKKGQDTSTLPKAITLSKAILYEVDSVATAPTWPLTSSGTDDPNTFIAANFVNEAKEYGLAGDCTAATEPHASCTGSDDAVNYYTVDPALVSTSFDTHKTVTLTSATLNGDDIMSGITTADDIKFLYKASGLALKTHKVILKWTDEAGNKGEATHSFKVAARAKTKVSVVPGWSMVSFPGDPADPAIDAVIGSTPVTKVYSYDPSVAGGWLVAAREKNADGTFTAFQGNLEAISSGRGYWVLTDTFEAISVDIPAISGGESASGNPVTPPSISVYKGWNLVPVIDVTGTNASSGITASIYLSGVSVTRIYLYDTISGKWQLKATSDALSVGKSYWVYASKDGVIVP